NHYAMGGIKTDINGQTEVPGLYAAGECACVSVHGGNRLGANSLLDTLIFGRRSGEHAAERGRDMVMPSAPESRLTQDVEQIDAIIAREHGGRRISAIKDELGAMMNDKVAVFREEKGLQEAHEIIVRLKEEAEVAAIDDRGTVFNQDVLGAIELGYLLDCAETTVVAAIERKESRGAQFRTDYPDRDDEQWLKHIDVQRGEDGAPELSYSPVTITRWQPEVRKY
ncbi:MAG: FAD-binding protein, partial [Solirubrobacterales bacterium]|nr:FAD-binding protein [Solirubrobacterales bacterium]